MKTPIEQTALLAAIIETMEGLLNGCNSYTSNHQRGVLRGLVWAYSGKDPGCLEDFDDTSAALGVKLGWVEDEDGEEKVGILEPR